MKRFLRRGKKQLEPKFDLIHIIKQVAKHNDHLTSIDEEIFADDSLNLDSEDETAATTN